MSPESMGSCEAHLSLCSFIDAHHGEEGARGVRDTPHEVIKDAHNLIPGEPTLGVFVGLKGLRVSTWGWQAAQGGLQEFGEDSAVHLTRRVLSSLWMECDSAPFLISSPRAKQAHEIHAPQPLSAAQGRGVGGILRDGGGHDIGLATGDSEVRQVQF